MAVLREQFSAHGREYAMRLGCNEACSIESKRDQNLGETIAAAQALDFGALRTIIQHSVKREDGTKIDEREAGEVLETIGLQGACEMLGRQFAALMRGSSAPDDDE